MALWHYEDRSDPSIGSRDIRFDIGPSWLWLEVWRGGDHWSLDIHTPLLQVAFLSNASAGRVIRVRLEKWALTIRLANDWHSFITLGILQSDWYFWKSLRALRRLTPENLQRTLATFRELTED